MSDIKDVFNKISNIIGWQRALILIMAKILKIPIASYIFAVFLGFEYNYLGLSVPAPDGYDAVELSERIEKNATYLKYLISRFINLSRNVVPELPEKIIAQMAVDIHRLRNEALFDIISDSFTKTYLVARLIKFSKVLGLDPRETLREILGWDISDERWDIWQKIVYIIISKHSERREVVEKREKYLEFLERKFSEKMKIYSYEYEFLNSALTSKDK